MIQIICLVGVGTIINDGKAHKILASTAALSLGQCVDERTSHIAYIYIYIYIQRLTDTDSQKRRYVLMMESINNGMGANYHFNKVFVSFCMVFLLVSCINHFLMRAFLVKCASHLQGKLLLISLIAILPHAHFYFRHIIVRDIRLFNLASVRTYNSWLLPHIMIKALKHHCNIIYVLY